MKWPPGNEYHYDSLDELKSNRGDKVKGLTITARFDGSYDSLTLEFERGAIVLRSDKTEKLIVLWHEMRDILDHRAPWYLRIVCWPPLLFVLLPVVLITPKPAELSVLFPSYAFWLHLVVLFVTLTALLSCLAFLWQPVVYLKKEHEVQGFFSRNSEKLIVGLIGSILGAIAKALFDKLAS